MGSKRQTCWRQNTDLTLFSLDWGVVPLFDSAVKGSHDQILLAVSLIESIHSDP